MVGRCAQRSRIGAGDAKRVIDLETQLHELQMKHDALAADKVALQRKVGGM